MTAVHGAARNLNQMPRSFALLNHGQSPALQGWVHAMFRIGRNQDVAADVDAGARAFLERDNRQAVEKVIQYLFAFRWPICSEMPLRISVEGSRMLPLLPICARPPRPPMAAAAAKACKYP